MDHPSSLWRTLKDLLHKRSSSPPDPAERRIWSRAACNLVTTCEAVSDGVPVQLTARVTNISRGGIGLHVPQRLEGGSLVRVDLPADDGGQSDTVLAYVMHATPLGGGSYALGCVFASELTDDDLALFGGKKVRHEDSDKRSWVRYATHASVSYSLVPSDDQPLSSATIVNVSASGLAMESTRPIAAGSLLSLNLHSNRTQDDRTILASVARISPQGDGKWLVGCNFIRELQDDELRAFV